MSVARIRGIGGTKEMAAGAEADLERRFAAFVATHRERAVGLAWRLLGGDVSAAEDVTQEALVRAFDRLTGFRDEASLSTWFYRILVNETHQYRRWRWVRERFVNAEAESPPDPAAERDPILRQRVARAIDALPRGQREAFVLVHLEGFTVSDAARITGRASGTVKSHLHRALRTLRETLKDLAPGRAESR